MDIKECWGFLTAEEFKAWHPGPPQPWATGTDVEGDVNTLWALVTAIEPRTIVELGVRHGITSRTLAGAGQASTEPALYCFDPDPLCAPHLAGLPLEFFAISGELGYDLWSRNKLGPAMEPGESGAVDLLMVDTDPHTYEQTAYWLNTWVADHLAIGGVAVFHDVIPAREEIKVRDAVERWLARQPADTWHWQIVQSRRDAHWRWGLGLLWRRA